MIKDSMIRRAGPEANAEARKRGAKIAVIQKALDYVTEALVRGDHIEFRDFGVFEVCVRKSRIGRNPNRPDDVVRIPERKVVKFKPGKKMKALVLGSE